MARTKPMKPKRTTPTSTVARKYPYGMKSVAMKAPVAMKSLPQGPIAAAAAAAAASPSSSDSEIDETEFDSKTKRALDKLEKTEKPRIHKTAAQRRKTRAAAMRAQQKKTDFIFPREPFRRIVRRLLMDAADAYEIDKPKLQASALVTLQCAAEAHIIGLFKQWEIIARGQNLCTILGKHLDIYRELCKNGTTRREWA